METLYAKWAISYIAFYVNANSTSVWLMLIDEIGHCFKHPIQINVHLHFCIMHLITKFSTVNGTIEV